jgi:hypothetical protein
MRENYLQRRNKWEFRNESPELILFENEKLQTVKREERADERKRSTENGSRWSVKVDL